MISNTDSAVMICGETGTGKEMIAQSIHTSGVRCGANFVSQNCAAIPENLLESIFVWNGKRRLYGERRIKRVCLKLPMGNFCSWTRSIQWN